MEQLRFYRRDEQVMSPFLTMLFAISVALLVTGVLVGSPPMFMSAAALWIALARNPEMLELPAITRLDERAERWAPYVIETAARARRASSLGFTVIRRTTTACACVWGLLLLVDKCNVADGLLRTLLAESVAVEALQAGLCVVIIGAAAIPAMWIIEWAERSSEDSEPVPSAVVTAASVAAGLRTRDPAVVAWWIVGVTGVFAVGPDLASRLLG